MINTITNKKALEIQPDNADIQMFRESPLSGKTGWMKR
jgi:hypothetical protein